MLTYNLLKSKTPLYEQLYENIKADILSGHITANEKLPSKRNLAKHLSISVITVENAYYQLLVEGYIYSKIRKGYYASEMEHKNYIESGYSQNKSSVEKSSTKKIGGDYPIRYDFTSNKILNKKFPFSIWARLMREVLSDDKERLQQISERNGIEPLRVAIASHLKSFHNLSVNPNRIVVGSGAQYLYMILVQILGQDNLFAIENPGYKQIGEIYRSCGARFIPICIDEQGLCDTELKKNKKVGIVHLSPSHHYPTGITMSINRRLSIINWANQKEDRYIIEDEYDSEFRLQGRPIQTMKSLAENKVIYMNTFSKTLMPNIRIAYMILPDILMDIYNNNLSFLISTVPIFTQYTMANFIGRGYFERHINRLKNHYRSQIKHIHNMLLNSNIVKPEDISDTASGTHFIINLKSNISDNEIKHMACKLGIKINFLSDYYYGANKKNSHLVINYSSLPEKGVSKYINSLISFIDRVNCINKVKNNYL